MRRFIEEFFDEWDAPATARARTVALTNLAGPPRLVNANEVANLPFGYMEAVANLIVRLHEVLLTGADSGGCSVSLGNYSNRGFVNDNTKPCFSPSVCENVRRSRIH